MEGSEGLSLTLKLDEPSLESLENLAAAQKCTIDEFVLSLVRRALRNEQRLQRNRAAGMDEAPLDAFLPEGADPFAPVAAGDGGLASSFADVQARMRFAGTPALFRGLD